MNKILVESKIKYGFGELVKIGMGLYLGATIASTLINLVTKKLEIKVEKIEDEKEKETEE